MAISHSTGADPFVVFIFHRTDGEILTLAFFRYLFKNLLVLLRIGRTPDNQRNIDGFTHLFYGCRSLFGARVISIGVGAFELENDHFSSKGVDTFFCPGHRIRNHIFEMMQGGFRPIFRFHIPYFHRDSRLIGHVTFELIERIASFTAESDRFFSFPNGNRFYIP